MRRYLLLPVAVMLSAGCGTEGDETLDPGPRVPPLYSLSPLTQWSGGEVTLRSSGVAAAGNPIVLAGEDTVSFVRVNDTTLTLRVPLGHSGPVEFVVHSGEHADSAGSISRVGLRSSGTYTGNFAGEFREVTRDGVPYIVAQNWGNGEQRGMVVANVLTGESTLIPDLWSPGRIYGAGISYRDTKEFILEDTLGVPGLYTLWPAPTRIADIVLDGTPITRQVAWLSDSVWLRTGNHSMRTYSANQTITQTDALQVESPVSLTFSPDRQLFAISTGGSRVTGGLPVIRAENGQIAYTIPSLTRGVGTSFTPDGERLLASGGTTPIEFLYEFDAANGTALDSVEVPIWREGGTYIAGLSLDPVKNRIYLLTVCTGDPRVVVFERSPLRQVGILPLSNMTSTCGVGGFSKLAAWVQSATNTLYLSRGGVPAERFLFDLLP